MKFYFNAAPNPAKVALMLEELELPYEEVPVDTRKGQQHTPEFRAVNPNAKVPAIDDDGTVVFDSGAILLYLAQKHGRFLPPAEGMGEMLSWYFLIATGVGPYSGQAVHFTRAHTGSDYATNRYVKEVQRHYQLFEDRLAGRDWIGGDDYGICDIAGWGWFKMAGYVLEKQGGLTPYPNLSAWFARVEARPAVARAKAMVGRHTFKTEMDEEALRSMFPQNY
ncbi:MAG: glutathione S-transferase family protein [Jannaschia sp.]